MEASPKCKQHGRAAEMYCQQCKVLACAKCIPEHTKKGCETPIFLVNYAENELLPLYKERAEKGTKTEGGGVKEFLASSKVIKEELAKLKAKFEATLKVIDKSLELFEAGGENLGAGGDLAKESPAAQYEELKKAIESEDLPYIVKQLDKSSAPGVGEGGQQLVEALTKTMSEAVITEKLKVFNDLLGEFNGKYESLIDDGGSDMQGKYIYGICDPQNNQESLCRYDIQSKKLERLLDIPKDASIIHVAGHTFVCGGRSAEKELKEYIEEYAALFPKASMKHAKDDHTIQVISKNAFVTVGGYNGGALTCCEEYSIADDKWEQLPSLNNPRYSAATVFLDNKLLYAIGGDRKDSSIEVLNYSEKKEWTVVKIMYKEVDFDYSPKALIAAKNEVLILCGNDSTDAGLWNLKGNVIKKFPGLQVRDSYFRNQIYMKDKKGYILGYSGHIHVFDLETRKFDELEHSSIFP